MRAAMCRLSMCVSLLTGCIAPQLKHSCPASCPDGQTCDETVGECKNDPCDGRCSPGQKCREGPPARCVQLSVGEVDLSGPDEHNGIGQPPPGQNVPGTH